MKALMQKLKRFDNQGGTDCQLRFQVHIMINHGVVIFRLPSPGLAEGGSEILVSWKSGSSIFLLSGRYSA